MLRMELIQEFVAGDLREKLRVLNSLVTKVPKNGQFWSDYESRQIVPTLFWLASTKQEINPILRAGSFALVEGIPAEELYAVGSALVRHAHPLVRAVSCWQLSRLPKGVLRTTTEEYVRDECLRLLQEEEKLGSFTLGETNALNWAAEAYASLITAPRHLRAILTLLEKRVPPGHGWVTTHAVAFAQAWLKRKQNWVNEEREVKLALGEVSASLDDEESTYMM